MLLASHDCSIKIFLDSNCVGFQVCLEASSLLEVVLGSVVIPDSCVEGWAKTAQVEAGNGDLGTDKLLFGRYSIQDLLV